MTIPKIIHHIAPKDESKHHPLWKPCYDSWDELVPNGYTRMLWNDKEDIDNLVKDHYPQHLKHYKSLPSHIMRIDFARFCILHRHGGIYADMDVYCYKDFTLMIQENDFYIVEAPWGDVPIENALMCSTKENPFFLECMKESKKNFKKAKKINKNNWEDPKNREAILMAAGPGIVDACIKKHKGTVGILHGDLFNNHGLAYHPHFFTRHVMTGMWGEDAFKNIEKGNRSGKPTKEFLKDLYMKEINKFVDFGNMSLDEFDFFTDYTGGRFMKRLPIWLLNN